MKEIYVRKDLRVSDRRQNTAPPADGQERRKGERRTACWDVANCDLATRQECYAFSSGRNCWDVWALRPIDRKFCCLKHPDCRQCPVVIAKFRDVLYIHVDTAPMLRRGVRTPVRCVHLSVDGLNDTLGSMVSSLSDLLRQDRDIFRCRRRGVHLESNYVSDICVSGHHLQCVFLED